MRPASWGSKHFPKIVAALLKVAFLVSTQEIVEELTCSGCPGTWWAPAAKLAGRFLPKSTFFAPAELPVEEVTKRSGIRHPAPRAGQAGARTEASNVVAGRCAGPSPCGGS